ncbi:hypothetical protein CAC42_8167 [Sphaceloma murrayae]|uniref:Uncharacterized protein n=1 Tax=Sphaceloma murrayae TaxID=2082308 RepID=A0A2K1QJ46_9PEZI|nr:hypothetical protein CAC42_8167 [Sphaceloma murrayae]
MGVLQVPPGGLSLIGWPAEPYKYSSKESTLKRSAILVKVNKQLIQELRAYSENGKHVRLQAGRTPRIQYGEKSIDLHLESENFTHELYTPATSEDSLEYVASVTQRATLAPTDTKMAAAAFPDPALDRLKSSLALMKDAKDANQSTYSDRIIPELKKYKALSERQIQPVPRSQGSSPSHGATKSGLAPTSVPVSDSATSASYKAMTKTVLHLLATTPMPDQSLAKLSHVPQKERLEILQKYAELDSDTKKWKLKDRSFKELDVWKWPYPQPVSRNHAIDYAIRAFDRLRLGKDDKHWQMLLQPTERGLGKCLSRLHGNKDLSTNTNNHHLAVKDRRSPLGASSPVAPPSDTEGKVNGRLTPKPASTPMARTASAPGKPMSIEKRLKESQKARAAEEAKEAKRKEKELKGNSAQGPTATKSNKSATIMSTSTPAATSTKKQQPAGKFKSAEVVHSSDDESDGEIKESGTDKSRKPVPAKSPVSTSSSDGKPLKDSSLVKKSAPHATAAKAAVSPNTAIKRDSPHKANVSKGAATPLPSAEAKAKAEARKGTPAGRVEKRSGSDGKTAASKPQLSPRKTDNKPKNPSPLGRTTSTAPSLFGFHERSPPVLVKKVTTTTAAKTARPAASTPSSARAEVSKKRPAPGDDVDRPRKAVKTHDATATSKNPAAAKPAPAKAAAPLKKTVASSTSKPGANSDTPLKRKANDISSDIHDHDIYPSKHRRTASSSTQSLSSSSSASRTTTARTSISSQSPPSHIVALSHQISNGGVNGNYSPSTASTSSDPIKFGWERALDDAERFRNEVYPRYMKMYEMVQAKGEKASREDVEALFRCHQEVKTLKEGIRRAALDEE